MNLKEADEALKLRIKKYLHQSIEAKQIASRLLKLFPTSLNKLAKEHTVKYQYKKKSSAYCYALCSNEYQDMLEKFVEIKTEYLINKIHYETHMMLFEARKSINLHSPRQTRLKS